MPHSRNAQQSQCGIQVQPSNRSWNVAFHGRSDCSGSERPSCALQTSWDRADAVVYRGGLAECASLPLVLPECLQEPKRIERSPRHLVDPDIHGRARWANCLFLSLCQTSATRYERIRVLIVVSRHLPWVRTSTTACFWKPVAENSGGFGASPPPAGAIPISNASGGGEW